jgi:hypothetical protein
MTIHTADAVLVLTLHHSPALSFIPTPQICRFSITPGFMAA